VPDNVIVKATSSNGAVYPFTAYAYDVRERRNVSVVCTLGNSVVQASTVYPAGVNTVECAADDNNSTNADDNSMSFNITVAVGECVAAELCWHRRAPPSNSACVAACGLLICCDSLTAHDWCE